MSINFPNTPVAGDKVTLGGRKYRYDGTSWGADDASALTRNRFVNPAMTISQEYPNLAGAYVAAYTDLYAADQWASCWSVTGCTVATNHVATNASYPCYPCRSVQLIANQASASVGASDYAEL